MNEKYMREITSFVKKQLPKMEFAIDIFVGTMRIISINEDHKKISFGVLYKKEEAVSLIQRRFAGVIKDAVEETIGKGYEISFHLMKNETNRLNPQYTFETFRIDNKNKEAVDRLREFLKNQRGGIIIITGYGKTHLLQALSHESQDKDSKLAFFIAEMYVQYLVEGKNREDLSLYKKLFYGNFNIAIDDIDFIFQKEYSEHSLAELLQTYKEGRHFLLSVDNWPPRTDISNEKLRNILNEAEVLSLCH
ncbi:MAG: DnaA/Hda family protein [Eubacteriales bacterium]|nr:DnaA/Hda family protein [Eubacteriales bacterium]